MRAYAELHRITESRLNTSDSGRKRRRDEETEEPDLCTARQLSKTARELNH